jgi:hypothetical protein
LHDGKEPYLKLGRLGEVKECREKRLADLMFQAALRWAGEKRSFVEVLMEKEENERV